PILTIFISLLVLASCKETKNNAVQSSKTSALKAGYEIEPVNIQNVKLTDSFWLPIIKRVQEVTIEYAIQKCNEEGRFENFLIAGKQKT
ncbi:glycoside hydrolase family 127 protein, partial [Flavobacterium sp. 3-210]